MTPPPPPGPMHKLLERQLQRLGLQPGVPPTAREWEELLERVSRTYTEADEERDLLERSQTLAINEMRVLTDDLAKARDAAEAMARVKSNFLANMSHEIRTPMNAVLGMAFLALQTELTPRQRDYLEKIRVSGQHLLGIINDILDISKIEAGHMAVEHLPFDLDQTLEGVLAIVGDKATEKGLELVLDVEDGVACQMIGDAQRIRQILINYLNNAIKFTHAGGILLQVGQEAADTPGSTMLRIQVKDTGIGIEPSQIDRIFQAFEQADTTTTRQYGGTGLGLAISRHLAEMMGGSVGVSSEPGKGSTFWFTAQVEPAAATVPALVASPELAGHRVLVVDDYPCARLRLEQAFRKLGLDVMGVASGPQALQTLQEAQDAGRPYEAIYLDMLMPEMDGLATAKAMEQLRLSPAPRIVFVTGAEVGEADLFSQVPNAVELLTKPATTSALLESVQWLFGASPELSIPRSRAGAADRHLKQLWTIAGARVLVVEDNELNQQVATELLHGMGLEVDVAANGAEAIERLQATDNELPSLVFMDMHMPVMDGIEATRVLRLMPRFAELPIIAMTANVMPQDRQLCLDAGMTAHLAKPIDTEELKACLLHWIPARPRPTRDTPLQGSMLPESTASALPTVVGLDTETGLRRCGGNPDFYRRMLEEFVRHWSDLGAKLKATYNKGDWVELHRMAHSFKSVCGTVGACDLQDQALRLERAAMGLVDAPLAPSRGVNEAMKRLLPELQDVLTALRAQLQIDEDELTADKPTQASLPTTHRDNVIALAHRVVQELESSEVAAIEHVESEPELFKAWLGPDYPLLLRALRAYDFERSIQLLRQAIERTSADGTA